MATLELASGLKLGIGLIDQQHARFYVLMNKLIAAEVGSDHRQLVREVLGELSDYVNEHFRTEEELMTRYEYPELAAHLEQHAFFRQRLAEFVGQYIREEIGVVDEMMAFLVDWFTDHVRCEDPKYAALFQANGM